MEGPVTQHTSGLSSGITEHTFSSWRHTSFYLTAGESENPPIIFVHGWPELSLSWRQQLPFVANQGYFAVAPDMRGYGNSGVYDRHEDYALREIVADMVELTDGLQIEKAIWVGHDWGAAVVWSIARHHPERCIAIANLCVPYDTLERGWDGILPFIDRDIYPQAQYPAGQWEYQRYYEEHFAEATAVFDSDPYRVAKLLFRAGDPAGAGRVSGTALTCQQNGWFGGGGVPDLPIDASVISEEDLQVYAEALERNSFFGPDSYYMNHKRNAQYAAEADSDRLAMPVLFLHGRYDYTCETMNSMAAEPMREKCAQLTEAVVDSGHWMAQEKPDDVNRYLASWLESLPDPNQAD